MDSSFISTWPTRFLWMVTSPSTCGMWVPAVTFFPIYNGLEFYIHMANSIFMNDHQPFHMWHCGSQLWPFFPFTCLTKSLQLSHPLFNSYNLLHSVIIFLSSHTLSHNTHLNNTLSQVMFYIYLYFSYVIYLLCYVFTILGIFFVS